MPKFNLVFDLKQFYNFMLISNNYKIKISFGNTGQQKQICRLKNFFRFSLKKTFLLNYILYCQMVR